ncbi:UDP-N-acetylmuramoylalanine--D-glutamate ligase [Thalassocella blandensis]|nr:UDP-N-acetylmuramoylalanine--D-glutamate ligase [Thalassocella blandensis]
MSELIATSQYSIIVGMGATGLSIARYLHARGEKFCLFDTRSSSSNSDAISSLYPDAPLFFAELDDDVLLNARQVCLSPGVSRQEAVIVKALAQNIPVVGDVEMFLQHINGNKPVIGITGSNGKSTVTSLVGLALNNAGKAVAVGGNIGTPALDLLEQDADIYVLELSSFQLESVSAPNLTVACVLNVSPDHMDRYDTLGDYVKAKHRIYFGAKQVVYHLHDKLTHPPIVNGVARRGFGLRSGAEVSESQYVFNADSETLMADGECLTMKAQVKIKGTHNIENALAVFAICDAVDLERKYVIQALENFAGLPHRTQWIAEIEQVTFINDSKATNVGAAEAAIFGLHSEFNSILLIAGGDGKGADFSAFGRTIEKYVRSIFLIGLDAQKIAKAVEKNTQKFVVNSLEEAVTKANEESQAGDLVLLSPACASMDMFNNFQHRGDVFVACVKQIARATQDTSKVVRS